MGNIKNRVELAEELSDRIRKDMLPLQIDCSMDIYEDMKALVGEQWPECAVVAHPEWGDSFWEADVEDLKKTKVKTIGQGELW